MPQMLLNLLCADVAFPALHCCPSDVTCAALHCPALPCLVC